MKRSNNKQKEMTAALYVRLSRDDNLEGDSYSIGNQKKLLTKIANGKGKDDGDGLTQKEGWCMIGNSKNRISPHS